MEEIIIHVARMIDEQQKRRLREAVQSALDREAKRLKERMEAKGSQSPQVKPSIGQ